MIERDHEAGVLRIVCDECGEMHHAEEPLEDGAPAYSRLVTTAKVDGWRVRPEDGGWTHTCRDCR
jgi:hypothetical protein